MKSKGHPRFWDTFHSLPSHIQQLARAKFDLWQQDPFHPSLKFQEIQPDIWRIRLGDHYRALARRTGDLIVWFWIGTHEDYNKLSTLK